MSGHAQQDVSAKSVVCDNKLYDVINEKYAYVFKLSNAIVNTIT